MSEPFMPTVDLSPGHLVKVEGGEVITWAEAVKRLSAPAPSQGAGIGREEVARIVKGAIARRMAAETCPVRSFSIEYRLRERDLAVTEAADAILALLEPRP